MMGSANPDEPAKQIGHLIDSATLHGCLHHTDWRIVDCRFDLADTERGQRSFAEAHIPGACYAHLDRDLSGPVGPSTGRHPLPDPGRLREWLRQNGVNNTTQVVAYDDSGGTMAVRLWWLLRWLGHNRVAVLDGGLPAWSEAGLALQPGIAKDIARGNFSGEPDDSMVIETAALAVELGQPTPSQLIDVRTRERFTGESEPIDPVAGHIPGAINLPLQDNLDRVGRFKSADQLCQLYAAVLDSTSANPAIVMCGSGVTACHSLLAMAIAGLPAARLYAGSWSEWIRDPVRPVATLCRP